MISTLSSMLWTGEAICMYLCRQIYIYMCILYMHIYIYMYMKKEGRKEGRDEEGR
jgi:hypothetical protein